MSSFNAQVGIGSILHSKMRHVLFLVLFFAINFLSAQDNLSNEATDTEPLISVVGDAVIYSKDASFNEQVRNNKNLQLHSKIEVVQKSDLKISSNDFHKKSKIASLPAKKRENIVIASKKEEKFKSENFPKKPVYIEIKNRDISNRFLLSSNTGNISFVPPSNDTLTSKYFIGYHLFEERLSVKFPNILNYYYKNRNLKKQISLDTFSVRPPPGVIF